MGTAATTVTSSAAARKRLRKSPFFTMLGLVMLVLAIGGFWPQYFSAIVGRTPKPTTQFWLIHVHAALFTTWLLFYMSQAALVMTGNTRLHLKAGPWVATYGFVIAAVGFYAAGVLALRLGVRKHDFDKAASFVFFPLLDMVFFAGFLASAVLLRKRPALHKRAMLLATFSIAVVGWGRFVGRMVGFDNQLIWGPLMLAPLLIAIAYDLIVCRRLYAIMVIGLALHLIRLNAIPFTNTERWLPIGRTLLAPFS